MAAPGSGELSLKKLAKEKHFDNYNSNGVISGAISLKDVTVGGTANSGLNYDTTNTQSPSFPDNNTGYGMTEFYSYDHDFVAIPCNKAMDVVFLLDYTGSMGNDMNTLKSNVALISSKVVTESGGDYRLAAVLIDQKSSAPSYWTGNNTTVSNLPSANKYNSGNIWLSAFIPFASTNKSDFDTKISYINGPDNNATNMVLGTGIGGPEPNDTAIDRVINNNLAGSFRSGVTRMVILITDNSPDGDGDDTFNGAEETTRMGTLSNNAVSNVCTISVLGSINNNTSADGTTTTHAIYNGYANNTGGLTNFSANPSGIVGFIGDICDDIEDGFATFSSEANQNTKSVPAGTVSATSVTTTSFTANFSVTLINNNIIHYWKPWATNSVGTSYGDSVSVAASQWTASANVSSDSTITSRGVIYATSLANLSSGTVVNASTAGAGVYNVNVQAPGGIDGLGWTYCNQAYSSTPSVSYSSGTVGASTGNQLVTYSQVNLGTGTKTQSVTENQVPLTAGNTYRLRGWFEKINNGGIKYSANIVSFTVSSTFNFTSSIVVGTDTYYSTSVHGYSNQYPFSMGSMSNRNFNSSSQNITGVYWLNGSTDYIYIYFNSTRKSFSDFRIGGTSYGASTTWSASGSNVWRKAVSTNPFPNNNTFVSIQANY